MIDASLTGVSESPKPILGEEELSESQDALYTQDNLTLPSAESPAHIEQDAAKELNGISKNENTVAVPVEEEEENNDHSEDAQNTLSEMTDALLGEPEGENGQFGLNLAAESIPVVEDMNTFDETSTDKEDLETENQDLKDTLAETEAMDEYLASLEKVSSNSASVEVEHYVNIASEVQEENYDNGDCVNTSEPIAEGLTSTDNDQVAFETEEDIEEESNGEGTDLGVLQSNSDAPVETSEALDKNASLVGTSSEGMKEGDVRISQLELPEFDDTPESDYQEDNGIDETKMKEDHVFDYISTQEAEGAFCGPTYEDAEITHAASQRLKTKETDLHQEKGSDHQQDISQESEDKVMENPETKSNQQRRVIEDAPEIVQLLGNRLYRSDAEHKWLSYTLLLTQILFLANRFIQVSASEECSHPQEEEDIMDIPLDDPEANKAAAKIQAGFRGHMTRKKLKPGDKPGEEVSSSGEALNGSQGDTGQCLSPPPIEYSQW
ncbi:hypothetical protein NFI96_029613 [Prochilodus magdalenae]|nr:hypothetical protein NFI96_029613 [Prochilodus magdalenae]